MIDIEKIKAAALAAINGYTRGTFVSPEAVLELIERLEAAEKDAAKWQAYQKRKQEVIAAGMGRKIMRGLEPYDALPAFYAAMKEKP